MWYARIRPVGKIPTDTKTVIGAGFNDVQTFEELWEYVQRNLRMHLKDWEIPSCPPYPAALDLLKHVGPDTPGYIAVKQTCAVWAWKFWHHSRFRDVGEVYILELWDSEADYALDEKYWTRSDE